ncbi:hypothetical protein BKA63DRAFT_99501 [Paraphoma chrysanthemicola]|nr:hypothetical protein BKA63DRAFT_99501 [Paraphoma chrysanthemicola]
MFQHAISIPPTQGRRTPTRTYLAPTIPWTTFRPISPALSDTSTSTPTTATKSPTRISSPLSTITTAQWRDDAQPDRPASRSSSSSYDRTTTGYGYGHDHGSRPDGLSPVPSSTYYTGSPELPELRPLSRLSLSSSPSVSGTILGVATSRPSTPTVLEAYRRSPLRTYQGESIQGPVSSSPSLSPSPSRRFADFDFGFDIHNTTTTPSPLYALNAYPDADATSLADTATDLSSLPPLTRCNTPALLGLASRIPLPRTPTPIQSARTSPAPPSPPPSTPVNSTRHQTGRQSAASQRSRFTEHFDLDGPSLYAQSQSSQAGLLVDANGALSESRIEGFGNGYENGGVVGGGAQGGGEEEEEGKDERTTEERQRDEEYAETVRRVMEMKKARGWRAKVRRGVLGVVCCGKDGM